jgi:signal transduction histidine kinase
MTTQQENGLLDLLPDGVVVADRQGVVTRVNDAARRLLGFEQEPVGRGLGDVLSLQDLDGRDWLTVTAPYTGLRIRRLQAEQSWHLADGTEVLVTARFHRPATDQPVDAVVVSLRSARARSRLDRERSDLVATVAHELRSPLTGVRGFTASLLERWDRFTDEQKRLIMETVHADTDRLTRLIAELLEVARIDTGRLSLHPRPTDAARVVEQVGRSIRAGTGREVRFDPPPSLPHVWSDPDRLAQVVTNLVENAVRHGEGVVTLSLSEGRLDDGRGGVLLAVEDEGDGISPEIRRRVFTKFWKHGTKGGSGLGLYIVHGLVVAHGGRIRIADAAGGGARIEVLWPTVGAAGTDTGSSRG